MGVHKVLLYGGVMAALSGSPVSALTTEIIIPLYQFPSATGGMWIDLRDAALNGHPITGIMNPNDGPNADANSTLAYQDFLTNVMGIGTAAAASSMPKPTIICYVATGFGDQSVRPMAGVLADIEEYETRFPGVCSGIFFDETSSEAFLDGNGDLNAMGQLYFDYNDAVIAVAGKTVTFNPGTGADRVIYGWAGPPSVVRFENFYSKVESAGVPRTPSFSTPDQNVMLMHTALELETDPLLVKAMVEKATCSGFGKLYFTGSTFAGNPWNETTLFWDVLVAEVSQDINITCPDSPDSQMRIMVPLLPDPVPSAADFTTMAAPILAVLSKSDYGDVVSVVLDASDATVLDTAEVLRDGGARVLCYLDAVGLTETSPLTGMFDSANAGEVCGGFFVDNFNTAAFTTAEIVNIYVETQFAISGSTVVFKPADDLADENAFLYANNWEVESFQAGRVIVATVLDGATSTTIPPNAAPRSNSAALMTGFSGNSVECAIADIAAEMYGYAYITQAADFATLSSSWGTLVAETSAPSPPSTLTCVSSTVPPTTAPPTTAPPTTVPPTTAPPTTAPPTTAPPTTAPPTTVPPTTPPPTTAPPIFAPVTACGNEPAATLQWFGGGRKLRISGGGCADLTRISNFLEGEQVTDVLNQVAPRVWELEGTLNVRVDSTVKIIGGALGECDELRLVTSGTPSRVLGNGGNIVIQNTKVFGWKNGAVDPVADDTRGYILCRSCDDNSTTQCTMSVTDSTIGYLGFGTVSFGGLSWKDVCDTPSVATAQNVTITENHRGIYARGADLMFDNITVSGGNEESIRVDRCSGTVSSCTATPPSGFWGIIVRRCPGILITKNMVMGDKGLWLALTDGLTVTENEVTPSSASVRVRTTNTMYSGNIGDGVFPGSNGAIGLRAQTVGCFTDASSSTEAAVNAVILANVC